MTLGQVTFAMPSLRAPRATDALAREFVARAVRYGLMGLGIFMMGIMAMLTKWLIDATVWYARLHYRVVKPALEPQSQV